MLLVPRRREHYAGISVNALGFAGSLFVPNPADLDEVRRLGPLRILAAVAGNL
jgi:ATP adenylyltransferase